MSIGSCHKYENSVFYTISRIFLRTILPTHLGSNWGQPTLKKSLIQKEKNRTVSVRFYGCGGGTLNILASLGASCTTFGDIFLIDCNLQRFSRHSPHSKRKAGALHLLFVLVAGVGLERPTRVACRFWRQTQFGTKSLPLWLHRFSESRTVAFLWR